MLSRAHVRMPEHSRSISMMHCGRARRWARASALAYMLLLHALVFFSMARLSHRHAAAVLPTGAELALLCQRAATRMAPPPPVI